MKRKKSKNSNYRTTKCLTTLTEETQQHSVPHSERQHNEVRYLSEEKFGYSCPGPLKAWGPLRKASLVIGCDAIG